jgi:hypothetical protein
MGLPGGSVTTIRQNTQNNKTNNNNNNDIEDIVLLQLTIFLNRNMNCSGHRQG